MKTHFKNLFIITISLLFLINCKEEEEIFPKIETEDVSIVGSGKLLVKGIVIERGSSPIKDHGILVSYTTGSIQQPLSEKISLGKEVKVGPFTKEVYLSTASSYNEEFVYVRTYLTNEKGTVYGKEVKINRPIVSASFVKPNSGKVGDKITIYGNFYNMKKEDFIVKFNHTDANIIEVKEDNMVVEVPANIDYYSYDDIDVTVSFSGTTKKVSQNFKLMPEAADFFPKEGSFGSYVTITGNYFSSNISVFLGETAAFVSSANNNSVSFYIPSTITSKSFKISIAIDGKSIELPGEFKMLEPTITSISKLTALPGESIRISGIHLSSEKTHSLKIGSQEVYTYYYSSEEILFNVPETLGTGTFPITFDNGLYIVTVTDAFTISGPQITDFTPKSGSRFALLTIKGSNFSLNGTWPSVLFGLVEVYPSEVTDNEIKVYVPEGLPSGQTKISIKAGNILQESKGEFVVKAAAIKTFSPASGTPGTHIVITGDGFNPNKDYNRVTFGTVESVVVEASNNRLEVLVPSNTTDSKMKISVYTGNSVITSANDFTVIK